MDTQDRRPFQRGASPGRAASGCGTLEAPSLEHEPRGKHQPERPVRPSCCPRACEPARGNLLSLEGVLLHGGAHVASESGRNQGPPGFFSPSRARRRASTRRSALFLFAGVSFLSAVLVLAFRGPSDKEGAPRKQGSGAALDIRPRKDHPRLFLTKERLAAVAARARGKLEPFYAERVKKDCDAVFDDAKIQFTASNPNSLMARTLSLLLCHRLEKNDSYRQKALALARAVADQGRGKTHRDSRIRLQALTFTYDWLFETLSREDKADLRRAIVSIYRAESGVLEQEQEFVSGHSLFTTTVLLQAALVLCDGSGEFEQELARVLDHWEKHLQVARLVAADGGYHLGWRYGREFIMRTLWALEALTTATDKNFFEAEKDWLSQVGYHCVYGLRPDNTYLRVGDAHREIYLNLSEDAVLYSILAARYRDKHLSWFAARSLEYCFENRLLGLDAQFVYPLLFYDPSVGASGPETLPPVRAFRRAGNYILRTGWGAGDTLVLFRAMPWYHYNHERRDFSSFTIYHKGGLATHSGTYQAGDKESDYSGSHLTNYAWRSVAHNVITVFDPKEKFCLPTGPVSQRCKGANLWANDGGQKFRSTSSDEDPVPSFQPRNAADIDSPSFSQGNVLIFEDRPELTYIAADGAKAYRRDKVVVFERHLLFLKNVAGWKQPVVVVFDRVTAADPSFKKVWNLHMVSMPRIEGNLTTIENKTRVCFCPAAKPGPKDYWAEYGGKLYCETLLPRDAHLEFVGGEGKEFWVNGRNYPTEIREVDLITEPGIGRLEVSPPGPGETDLFLHVLSPTDIESRAPRPQAKLVDDKADVVALVGNHVLLFRRDGATRPDAGYAVSHAGPLIHVLGGLPPSKDFSVRRGGQSIAGGKSSDQGILIFRSTGGGEFQVSPKA